MEGVDFRDYKKSTLWIRAIDGVVVIVRLTRRLPKSQENKVFINQILRSASSVGANISEASAGHSRKEFCSYMNIARREAVETDYWLRLLYRCNPPFGEEIARLGKEYQEIVKILSAIVHKSKA